MENKVLYSAVVLTPASRELLLEKLSDIIPEDWKVIAHHSTIVFGKELPIDLKKDLGNMVFLTATEVGLSDMAMAVKVVGYHSDNKTPHITIAINPIGGKAVMSNEITKWEPIQSIQITGIVTEIKK